MGDQRNGEAASRRGGGGYHGQVATVSIYDDVVLLCVSVCVVRVPPGSLLFVFGLNSNSSSLHLILYEFILHIVRKIQNRMFWLKISKWSFLTLTAF